jgi:2-iminobutanoate/2-iminopropanoate deaminase
MGRIERRSLLKKAAAATGAIAAAGLARAAEAPAKGTGVKFVSTDGAPKAIGPYAQGVEAGGFLFLSGQVPLDPAKGELVTASLDAAVERILDNLEAVLMAAGLGFSDVVKTTVYLTKAEDFAPMNAVYGKRMGEHKPARSTVVVAALPRNAPLEIEMIAKTRG